MGEVTNSEKIIEANLHNFMEIMSDGSVKIRILLTNNENKPQVDIRCIMSILSIFQDIYSKLFEKKFERNFIGAYKYEELTVQKQFTSLIQYDVKENDRNDKEWKDFQVRYIENYGNNLIITGDRIPRDGLYFLDKRYFNRIETEITNHSIIEELFRSHFSFVGYVLGE